MSILTNLQERKRKLAKQIVDLQNDAEASGKWESEEREKFDKMTADFDGLAEEIKVEEDRAAKVATYQQLLEEDQEILDAHRGFGEKRESAESRDVQYTKKFSRLIRSGVREDVRPLVAELRALGSQIVGTSGYGGVLVPTEFQADLLKGLDAFGGVGASRSRLFTTARGGTLRWPLINDVANEAKYLDEATAASTSTPVSFKTIQLYDFKLTSGPIKVSREMRADGLLDVDSIVREAMNERFMRKMENEWANSTAGTTDASGLYACSTLANAGSTALTITPGSSNITPELLIDLQHAVDPAYRANGEFMFDDATFSAIRQLRWGSSNPFIWQPSYVAGAPDAILGKPYIVNNSFATAKFAVGSSGTFPIWFGDFYTGYWRRLVLPPTITVLTERYADEDVVGIIGFARFDGRPMSSDIGNYPLAAVKTT